MSENRIQKEPSTEEILGSIRRIITEDNAQADSADAAATESDSRVPTDDMAADEIAASDVTAGDAGPSQIAAGEEATEDDEILELTDEVADGEPVPEAQPDTADQPEETRREPRFGLSATPRSDGGVEEGDDIRREPVIDVQPGESPSDEPQTQGGADSTGDIPLPLQGYNYSPQVLSSTQDSAGQEEDAMESTAPEEPEAPETAETAEPDQPAAEEGGVPEEIVSPTATAATAAALGDLSRAVSEKTGKLKLGGETTVADIVKEMLRPMLREWLDENLPLIVDRVVRREIQKLVDRAQDDD